MNSVAYDVVCCLCKGKVEFWAIWNKHGRAFKFSFRARCLECKTALLILCKEPQTITGATVVEDKGLSRAFNAHEWRSRKLWQSRISSTQERDRNWRFT